MRANHCADLVGAVSGFATDDNMTSRLAAGATLVTRSLDREIEVFEWIASSAHIAAASVLRASQGSSSKLKAQASEMLANAVHRGGYEILASKPCMVSCVGAFCMDGESSTLLDACSVLCAAATREAWGPCLELGFVVESLGSRLFQLCCALDGPQVRRDDDEELLVAKIFELVWRLLHHRHCKAFKKLCDLEGHQCVLTAAISFLYDSRAKECRHLRHYRDGPVSDLSPSGLDCCLRVMEGIALHDRRQHSSKGRSRLLRAAGASRALRASQSLTESEAISCEILVMTVTPGHCN